MVVQHVVVLSQSSGVQSWVSRELCVEFPGFKFMFMVSLYLSQNAQIIEDN